jgi:mannose-1-phosphate guanylyltransferase
MKQQYRINGWLARGVWSDVGSPKSLREATAWILQTQAGRGLTAQSGTIEMQGTIEGPVQITGPVRMGTGSCIVGPVIIDAGTVIGENVLIGPYSSIGKNCQIQSGSRIFSTSLYDDVTVGNNSVICGTLIDEKANIGSDCTIEFGSVIVFDATIGDGSTVYSNFRIWPEYIVSKKTRVDCICLSVGYDHSYGGS